MYIIIIASYCITFGLPLKKVGGGGGGGGIIY